VTWDILTGLAACLKTTLEDAEVPTCYTGVFPGDAVPLDLGGCKDGRCGMAWTRLGTAYPSSGVGQQDTTVGNCGKGLGLDIEVGVMRCIQVDREGKPRDPENVARQQVADMMLMRKAIFCCDTVPSEDLVLNTYQPSGPLGVMVGGTWLLHVGTL
jgi:hypothetical protein